MELLLTIGSHIVLGIFLLGVAGCIVTIPMAAWGYFSVLFQSDEEEERRRETQRLWPDLPAYQDTYQVACEDAPRQETA